MIIPKLSGENGILRKGPEKGAIITYPIVMPTGRGIKKV